MKIVKMVVVPIYNSIMGEHACRTPSEAVLALETNQSVIVSLARIIW